MSVETLNGTTQLVPADSAFKIRSASIKKFSKDHLTASLRTMMLSRRLDDKMLTLLKQGRGFFHIGGSGHEAIQVAAGRNMIPRKDWGMLYYRDMSFALTMGMTARQLLSAHLSKMTDTSAGRQMPSHFNSRELNIVSVNSALGAQFLPGLGIAQAIKFLGDDEVVYISTGDGGTSEGSFFELLNWATRDKVPAVIVVQDNKFAISVPVHEQTSNKSISKTVQGFENLEIIECDGTDYLNAYAAMEKAVAHARSGKGPALVHAHVVRLLPHSSSDDHRKYRSAEDLEADKAHDPITKLSRQMMKAKIITQDEIDALFAEVKQQVDEDTKWCMAQEDPKPEDAVTHVLYEGESDLAYETEEPSGEPIVMVDAINHALYEEMERDERVIVFGEDVAGGKGGVFTATRGLTDAFGSNRCYNSPIAEASIIGTACGLSIKGFKPVPEIQFADYIWPAMQMLRNQVPVLRYRSNNHFANPMVIRVPCGGYIHGGLCHSQNIEATFGHIPGYKIVMPSNAADAKGLLKTAIRGEDPVIYLEHKFLYRQGFARRPEPGKDFLVPIGKASVVREGTDLTIVTYGALVQKALNAAKAYAKKGVEIEVIDLRTIVPYDAETVHTSVKKTNRVLVLHEDYEFLGFGAEISAQIADHCFESLDAPIVRVAAKFAPIGFAAPYEDYLLPNDADVTNAIERLTAY
ncbi:MAG: dehydrogenase E1 component subunit alpha/beta [Candidatus Cyclonatronum sp.]|uniref:alpha-ketoacid dehydrogenase subunit alpha/beta n=1 Tax=Cyclonatronum sp. TaxID=3024185 RepID=UPI0025C33E7C|nr:dehydrogenase E1 component subunit alpha/beta [Cyclonatronum sp.]MCH8486078.1 dehydrogenase E1 component subunit alpha/beta [Cyclonatronum sp.]